MPEDDIIKMLSDLKVAAEQAVKLNSNVISMHPPASFFKSPLGEGSTYAEYLQVVEYHVRQAMSDTSEFKNLKPEGAPTMGESYSRAHEIFLDNFRVMTGDDGRVNVHLGDKKLMDSLQKALAKREEDERKKPVPAETPTPIGTFRLKQTLQQEAGEQEKIHHQQDEMLENLSPKSIPKGSDLIHQKIHKALERMPDGLKINFHETPVQQPLPKLLKPGVKQKE